jgi:hypothetical protein
MAVEFEFKCVGCGEMHRGMPAFGADHPLSYFGVPKDERARRCVTSSDDCIDGTWFFVRGCLEIPVHGAGEAFEWGVWVSLSEASYRQWRDCFGQSRRSHIGPFFGWLNTRLKPYPDTVDLKTTVHLRDNGIRPRIELEPTEHPLAVEQREGISQERLAAIYALMMHEAR